MTTGEREGREYTPPGHDANVGSEASYARSIVEVIENKGPDLQFCFLTRTLTDHFPRAGRGEVPHGFTLMIHRPSNLARQYSLLGARQSGRPWQFDKGRHVLRPNRNMRGALKICNYLLNKMWVIAGYRASLSEATIAEVRSPVAELRWCPGCRAKLHKFPAFPMTCRAALGHANRR